MKRTGVQYRERVLTVLALASVLAACLAVPAGAQEAEPQADTEPQPVAEAASDPPRDLTRAELQREIDLVERELEELTVRIGDQEPDATQRRKLRDLLVRLHELKDMLRKAEAEYQAKMEKAGRSFKGRWMRVREAIDDFTTWDVKDGMFRIRVGARFQIDATTGSESDALKALVGPIDTGLEFRRFRIFAVGRLFRRLDFKVAYDFSADAGLKDAYLEGTRFTKIVRWRIGHFKEPFSMSRQSSGNDLPFLEWPLPVQAIAPGRNWGAMLRHREGQERLTWAVSATTNGKLTDDNRSNSKISLTGRITGLPIYHDEGRRLLHLGLSYGTRNPRDDSVQLAARPEARFAPFFANTGPFEATGATIAGFEAAGVHGPYWAQAEYIRTDAETESTDDLAFAGMYLELGYFVTGESRFYRTIDGTFGRLTPHRLFHGGNPFTGKGEGGALEITSRFSYVDLNDGVVRGGRMEDYSLGINWYLSQSSRVMFDYIHSELLSVGRANIFLLRYQFNP
jgi:phosphate-selective porin OprO/OprP